jgi:hypothetical protein
MVGSCSKTKHYCYKAAASARLSHGIVNGLSGDLQQFEDEEEQQTIDNMVLLLLLILI